MNKKNQQRGLGEYNLQEKKITVCFVQKLPQNCKITFVKIIVMKKKKSQSIYNFCTINIFNSSQFSFF